MSTTAPQRKQHDPAMIRRAQLLHSRGYTPREIRIHMLDENLEASVEEIREWVYKRADMLVKR